MEPQTIIARRIARELTSGMLVNLGIGIPTLVANYLPEGMRVFFQSENGLIGTGSPPGEGMGHPTLTDAGGRPVTALPGASTFDSAMSFGLIRGGHLDLTVLGGLQVDQTGLLANWMIPNKMVPGMGGAMDLVSGAKRVIVAMQHTAKGAPKIMKRCTLPITSVRPIDLLVTELAVIAFAEGRATLRETGPAVSVEQVVAATDAELSIPDHVPEMTLTEAPKQERTCHDPRL
jgi:acetate CoA/acetoacetate CoA-transferase beta subunit